MSKIQQLAELLGEAKKVQTFSVGDMVQYSREWLKNTGQNTGSAPRAKGKVVGVSMLGANQLVEIDWDVKDLPKKVIAPNLNKVGSVENV
jgi:hypothetical protein